MNDTTNKADSLHAAIMNLASDPVAAATDYPNKPAAYFAGHRDARHATAELVSEFLSQPGEAKGAEPEGFKCLTAHEKMLIQRRLIDAGTYDYVSYGAEIERVTLTRAAARIAELERQNGELVEAARALLDDMARRAKARGDVDDDGTAILDAGATVVSNIDAAIASAAGKEAK